MGTSENPSRRPATVSRHRSSLQKAANSPASAGIHCLLRLERMPRYGHSVRSGISVCTLMSMRSLVAMVVLLGVIGCTVPGSPYSYLDVRVSGFAQATIAWPSTTQSVGIRQSVHSPYNQSLSVPFEIRDDTDADPLTFTVVNSGTVVVPAFGDATISVDLGVQPAAIHVYSVVLDPANILVERYESNNVGSVLIPVADLDIVFGSPAPAVATPVPISGDITLNFAITNSTNPGAAPGSSTVSYAITVDGVVTPAVLTTASLASPVVVNGGATTPVSVTLPNPGAGHTLTITLTSSVQERSVTNSVVTVVVPAAG